VTVQLLVHLVESIVLAGAAGALTRANPTLAIAHARSMVMMVPLAHVMMLSARGGHHLVVDVVAGGCLGRMIYISGSLALGGRLGLIVAALRLRL